MRVRNNSASASTRQNRFTQVETICPGGARQSRGRGRDDLEVHGITRSTVTQVHRNYMGLIVRLWSTSCDCRSPTYRRFVTTREEVRAGHAERLQSYRHVRYMWFPYTDKVYVDVSNPAAVARRKDPVVLTPKQVCGDSCVRVYVCVCVCV